MWNTLAEESVAPVSQRTARSGLDQLQTMQVRPLLDVSVSELPRLDMGDKELNRVLGGGSVPGGVVLLGGEPGIGKSTLMLHHDHCNLRHTDCSFRQCTVVELFGV